LIQYRAEGGWAMKIVRRHSKADRDVQSALDGEQSIEILTQRARTT